PVVRPLRQPPGRRRHRVLRDGDGARVTRQLTKHQHHGTGQGPSQRQLRVAEEIRHVLAGLFTRNQFRDPELGAAHIPVPEVRLRPDLKYATAFVSRLGRSDVDALLPALHRVAPYLRGQVAKALQLRAAPDITFQPDHALDYAMKIDELMHRPE